MINDVMLTFVSLLDDLVLGLRYSNIARETGGLKLELTITLVLQANQLTKCTSHPVVTRLPPLIPMSQSSIEGLVEYNNYRSFLIAIVAALAFQPTPYLTDETSSILCKFLHSPPP